YLPGGKGEKQFLPLGTTALSSGKWITFTPQEEVLKPFGRITVRYTIKVPEEAKGGYFSVLFLETALGIAKDEEGANVLVSGRIGALFFIHVKGTVDKKGEIRNVEIKAPEGNKPLEIATTFANTGNVDVTVGGNFLLMDSEENVAARGTLDPIYTFPGATETGVTKWVGRLAPGKYQALLTYDLGKGQSLVEERTLTVG
ncbi:MAG TPA: hypothetical protein VL404_07495, partial [Candidatus Eisenbacteria bacterium]|nr:hypothetical protein [Candidatus Eisenbacteria bacterium]